MVSFCCVRNCHNKSDREKDRRYFSMPTVVKHQGKQIEELTARRRREWIAQLRLKTLTFQKVQKWRYVCSDHFVSGNKSYLMDITNPDWKPSQRLGHEDGDIATNSRYERQQARKRQKISELNLADDCETSTCSQNDHECGISCQTEWSGPFTTMSPQDVKSLQDEVNRLTQENKELSTKLENSTHTLESLEGNDDTVKYFTGLTNFITLSSVFAFVLPYLPKDSRRVLNPFQSFLLTLMHILSTPIQHLGYIFNVSKTTATKVFNETLNVLYYRLQRVVFWPDRECIRTSMPAQFSVKYGGRIASIIDCFELFIERPSSVDASAQTWSNYKHNNTIKYLISITPQGHISFISEGWGGRVSDKHLIEHSKYLNNLLPNDIVLADRGFDIQELVGRMGAEVKIPAFTKGKPQLSAYEIEQTRNVAHLRIHVERVIGLLCGKYTLLSSEIPIALLTCREGEHITTLDKIVRVACACVNICEGIIS